MNYVTAFYDKFWERIESIKTVNERNNILSDMQEEFQSMVRREPENRNSLSEVYQKFKIKCWEATK